MQGMPATMRQRSPPGAGPTIGEADPTLEENMDYPGMITNLPEADIPFDGVRGWLLQGPGQQMVFMDIAPVGAVPEHSHRAQFGVVLDGEMTLTIAGESRRLRKGDTYFIPDGVVHSAVFHTHVKVLDMFDEPGRYQVK